MKKINLLVLFIFISITSVCIFSSNLYAQAQSRANDTLTITINGSVLNSTNKLDITIGFVDSSDQLAPGGVTFKANGATQLLTDVNLTTNTLTVVWDGAITAGKATIIAMLNLNPISTIGNPNISLTKIEAAGGRNITTLVTADVQTSSYTQPISPTPSCQSCTNSYQCSVGKYCDLNTKCCTDNLSGCPFGCTESKQCTVGQICTSNCCTSNLSPAPPSTPSPTPTPTTSALDEGILDKIINDLDSIQQGILNEVKQNPNRVLNSFVRKIQRCLDLLDKASGANADLDLDVCGVSLSRAQKSLGKTIDQFEVKLCPNEVSSSRCIPEEDDTFLDDLQDVFDRLDNELSTDEDEDGIPDVCGYVD